VQNRLAAELGKKLATWQLFYLKQSSHSKTPVLHNIYSGFTQSLKSPWTQPEGLLLKMRSPWSSGRLWKFLAGTLLKAQFERRIVRSLASYRVS
jgi:hypothetical protein